MYSVADKIRVLAAKVKWPAPKVKIPKGLFTKKDPGAIKEKLIALHGGDKKKAMDSLMEYINRGGKNIGEEQKSVLNKVKGMLKNKK